MSRFRSTIVRLLKAQVPGFWPPERMPLVSPIQRPPSRIPESLSRPRSRPSAPVPAMMLTAAGLELIGSEPRLCVSVPAAGDAASVVGTGWCRAGIAFQRIDGGNRRRGSVSALGGQVRAFRNAGSGPAPADADVRFNQRLMGRQFARRLRNEGRRRGKPDDSGTPAVGGPAASAGGAVGAGSSPRTWPTASTAATTISQRGRISSPYSGGDYKALARK